jgi:multiple sugar transport system ATP-binding protein
MDEPLSSLDAKLRIDMRTELKHLHERLGGTFVYVTHDQAEAMTMADRIVVMNGGAIEQLGGPLDIYRRPETRFVAGFFGMPTMNFIDGEIAGNGAAPRFRADRLESDLPADLDPTHKGRRIVLGVRSEHVHVAKAIEAGAMPATVNLIEPMGDVTLVFFEYGGAIRLVAKVDPDLTLVPGDRIQFKLDPANCHLFDADSGARLN